MNRLRTMLALLGVLTVGGTAYLVATPKPGITRADLLDAGLAALCDPAQMECRVRSTCSDAGIHYGVVRTKVGVCDRNSGNDVLLFRWPKRGGSECVQTVGTPDEACKLVEAIGTCSDATLCPEAGGGVQPTLEQAPLCACTTGANCTWTPPGGVAQAAPRGNTLEAGTWAGAGCTAKYCGPIRQGDAEDWPPGCPRS